MKKCPYCAEEILAEAKKCRYCGEFLDDTLREERHVPDDPPAHDPPSRGGAAAEAAQLEIHPVMFKNNPVGFVLALLLCLVGIGILILLGWWLVCRATTLTVTDKRTILRRGLFSKYTTEVYHEDIRNVQIGQSLFQRMFGVGYLGISSAGQSGVEIGVNGLTDPEAIKDLIDKYRQQT